MRKSKLVWQLYLSYLVIVLLALTAVTWYISKLLQRHALDHTTRDLQARALLVGEIIRLPLVSREAAVIDSLCKALGSRSATRITVVDTSGRVIGDSDSDPTRMDNHGDRPEIKQALAGGTGTSARYSSTMKQTLLYVAVPVFAEDRMAGVLRCSVPVAPVGRQLYGIYGRTIIGALVIAVLIAGFSLLISRRISRPLEEMNRAAERFARGELHHRVVVQGSDELGRVAESLNQMAYQLDERIRTITDQRNQQEAILSSMSEGVLAVDSEERILIGNRAASRLLGIEIGAHLGRSVQEALRVTAVQEFISRVLRSAGPLEQEIELHGGGQILRGNGALLRDSRGNRLGAVVVFNDITQLRRVETVRRDFVANVSHELKTPITSLKGFLETLLDGAVERPEDARRFLQIMERQIDRLDDIIDDLLLLSRLEQEGGKEKAGFAECRLVDVLVSAVEVCGPRAAKREVPLVVECPDTLTVYANTHLLEQAVVNLVENAIKYSEPHSPVRITGERTAEGADIRVEDQGCGIPDEHQSRLFERFYRVDRARSRKLGGTGLGLAIVKHIAQVHRGAVSVQSVVGKGSTFTVRLPV